MEFSMARRNTDQFSGWGAVCQADRSRKTGKKRCRIVHLRPFVEALLATLHNMLPILLTNALFQGLVLALGIGVASVLRSRNALVDGFGMIVLAMLCSGISVLAIAILSDPMRRNGQDRTTTERSEA